MRVSVEEDMLLLPFSVLACFTEAISLETLVNKWLAWLHYWP